MIFSNSSITIIIKSTIIDKLDDKLISYTCKPQYSKGIRYDNEIFNDVITRSKEVDSYAISYIKDFIIQ